MAIDIKKWNKRVQSEVKDKNIRFELNKKFQGEYKTLTEEQAEEIFRSMTGIKTEAADTIDIKKWNKIVQDKVADKNVRFELNKKFQGEYKKLTEDQAREIFKSMTGAYPENIDNAKPALKAGEVSPKAGIWKEQVRKEFSPQNGPQYQRLMNQIDSGEIQTQEDFDKALENEKKDWEDQKQKLYDLKKSLKARVNKEMSKVKSNKDLGVQPEFIAELENDLINEIDKLKDYNFPKARGEGKSEEQIRKEVENIYNLKIDNTIKSTTSEAKAYKLLNEIIEDLRDIGTSETKSLADELEKILYGMGPARAYEVAQEKMKKLKASLNENVKNFKNELKIAQKAAEKNKGQIVSVLETMFDKLRKKNFSKYNDFAKHVSNDKFYRVKKEEILKDAKGKEKLVEDILGRSNFVVFEDEKDYEQFIQNPKKFTLVEAKKLFDADNSPELESKVENVEAMNSIFKNLNTVKRLIIEFN